MKLKNFVEYYINRFSDKQFYADFIDTVNEEVKDAGNILAKSLIKEYKETGVFSGVYIFSKSLSVIGEMVDMINS